jgi:hypothetical protein
MHGSVFDIATGNTQRKSETGVDHDGIAWVSGQGGTRATDLYGAEAFLLEVAGVTPDVPDVGTPTHTDWFLV